jgi:hypothetical protein
MIPNPCANKHEGAVHFRGPQLNRMSSNSFGCGQLSWRRKLRGPSGVLPSGTRRSYRSKPRLLGREKKRRRVEDHYRPRSPLRLGLAGSDLKARRSYGSVVKEMSVANDRGRGIRLAAADGRNMTRNESRRGTDESAIGSCLWRNTRREGVSAARKRTRKRRPTLKLAIPLARRPEATSSGRSVPTRLVIFHQYQGSRAKKPTLKSCPTRAGKLKAAIAVWPSGGAVWCAGRSGSRRSRFQSPPGLGKTRQTAESAICYREAEDGPLPCSGPARR